MFEFISISDWIQIIIAIITLFSVISSIAIAIATLKQNNKMIEDSTRPYIAIYKETLNINKPREYIAIKNFGSSFGKITNLEFDKSIFNKINNGFKTEIKFLNNITLAPNQKYLLPIKTSETDISNIIFHLEYKSSTHNYKETFDINLEQDYSIAYNHQNKSTSKPLNELFTISNSIQELIKKL